MTNDFELMQKGICPVCHKVPSRHSKQGLKVCLNIMRQRHGIKPAIVEVDGKHYEVSARAATPEEIEAAKESQDVN